MWWSSVASLCCGGAACCDSGSKTRVGPGASSSSSPGDGAAPCRGSLLNLRGACLASASIVASRTVPRMVTGRGLVVPLVFGRAFGFARLLSARSSCVLVLLALCCRGLAVRNSTAPFGFSVCQSSHDCCLTPMEIGRLARALLVVLVASSLIGSGYSGAGGSVLSSTIGSLLSVQ